MAAGSLYDLVFAAINLSAPRLGSRLLEVPLPAEQVYLRLTGVFLLILALFYLLPVIHPGRYLGNVSVAIVGRCAGALFMAAAALWFGQPPAFLALAAGDILFAALHAFFLVRAEGGNPLRHFLG